MDQQRTPTEAELAHAYQRLLAKRKGDRDRYPAIKEKKKEQNKQRYLKKKELQAQAQPTQ